MDVPPNAPAPPTLEKESATHPAEPHAAPPTPDRLRILPGAFAVERLLWLRCTVLLGLSGLGLMLLGRGESSTTLLGFTQLAWLVPIVIASGWGSALLIESRARRKEEKVREEEWPTEPTAQRTLISFAVIWVVVFPAVRWATGHLEATAFWMGQFERLLLLPTIAGLFVAVLVGAGLRRGVVQFGALILTLVFISDGLNDSDGRSNEQVSTATTAQLAYATKSGEPVLLRGTDHLPDVRVEDDRPAPKPKVCQSITFTDRLHTLLGSRSRTLDVDFDACWNGPGAPVSVTVAARRYAGNAGGNAYAVRLLPTSAFDRVALPPVRGDSADRPGNRQRLRYGDTRAAISSEPLDDPYSRPLKMRGADGLLRDDADPSNDTVVARVDDGGGSVTVVVAVESSDGVFKRVSYKDDKYRTQDRLAGAKPGPGRSLDVVTATIPREGPAVAKLRRTTAAS
jgi:hypothetical protein